MAALRVGCTASRRSPLTKTKLANQAVQEEASNSALQRLSSGLPLTTKQRPSLHGPPISKQ